MPPGHRIAIEPTAAHVEVRVGGELLASTDRAMVLHETGLPDRYYLPRTDVRMDRLRPTSFHTTCPWKGEASYWSVEMDGHALDGVVWGYETPREGAEDIAGMLSFYPDRTEISVDGSPVTA